LGVRVLLIYKEGQRDSTEKPSKMRLDTIRGGPKGLRADIGSLKRFRNWEKTLS
jgi:hypothetical protein